MQRYIPVVALAAALLAPGGCAPGILGGSATGQVAEETVVHVQNHNWADVTVYMLRSGVRVRLGTVSSMGQETFQLPRGLLAGTGDIQLLVDPIGSSQGYLTEMIMIAPGQTIDFTVENNLNLSSYSVW